MSELIEGHGVDAVNWTAINRFVDDVRLITTLLIIKSIGDRVFC